MRHIAALVACLPNDACIRRAANPDSAWGLDQQLMAGLNNSLNSLIWGMGDPKKRGAKPVPIGPSWMKRAGTRSLETRVMTPQQLMAELAKPRTSRG